MQVMLFPDAVAAAAGVTLTLLKSFGENEKVHIRPDVWTPVEVYQRGRLTVEPRAATPEAKVRVGAAKAACRLANTQTSPKACLEAYQMPVVKYAFLRKYYVPW